MNKIFRRPLVAAATTSVALLLAACGNGSSSGSAGSSASDDITIAGVYGLTSDPFWTSIGCGAKEEAAKLGVTFKEFTSTGSDTAAYSSNFSSAQVINPDGIFVNPTNPNQFITQYKQLMAKGVPVVTINSTDPPAQYKVVGTDTTDTSFLSSVADLVPDQAGSMAVIDGIPGLVPVESRLTPVVDAITKARTNLTVLPTEYTGFDVTKATSTVSSLLIAHPDLRVVVAADGPDGQATAAAVKQAGKAGQVKVIALDAVPAEVSALKDGTITGLVAQAPEQIGQQQLKTLVDYIRANPSKGAVPASSDQTGVPQRLLTKDNVDDPDSAPYIYKPSC